jgi:hypothetical protein
MVKAILSNQSPGQEIDDSLLHRVMRTPVAESLISKRLFLLGDLFP